MNIQYRAIIECGGNQPNACFFYDEDREAVIREIKKYCDKNGFSIQTGKGTFSIRNLILSKETLTGEILEQTPYCELFDVYGNKKST